MTIQHKTALIFTGITAAILVVLSSVAYFFTTIFAFQDFYKRLEIRGILTAKGQLEHHTSNIRKVYIDIRSQHLEPLPGEKEFFFPTDSLQAFIRSRAIADLPETFYRQLVSDKTVEMKLGHYFYTGFLYHADKPYVVIVGAQNDDSIMYARKLKLILVACCLIGTAVAYALGIFFSRHTFKPVRDIIERAKTIGIENLHLRLQQSNGQDEIAELALTFNSMLSRLETAFETQNNFVSNASHELRTPLTAIYGEAEIALSRNRSEEEYRQSLGVIVSQSEKLQHLTDSLLNLAQTGFDGKKQNLAEVRIDELILEVKVTINNIIPDSKIYIDFTKIPANARNNIVTGNYPLLKLGLSNVMENACKYSDNKPVTVSISKVGDMLEITVRDEGIGIPEEELKYIYDPFFRASNTGKYEGYGIGLPLTRNIFRIHKGTINVHSSANKGTTVQMLLPIADLA